MSVTFGLEVEDGFYTNGLRNRSHTIASLSQCVLSPTRYYMLLNPYYILISHAYLQTVLYVFPLILVRGTILITRVSLIGDHFLYSHYLNV